LISRYGNLLPNRLIDHPAKGPLLAPPIDPILASYIAQNNQSLITSMAKLIDKAFAARQKAARSKSRGS
jgi:hypothetical protein